MPLSNLPGPWHQVNMDLMVWAHIDRRGPDVCWPWLGSTTAQGYGKIGTGYVGTRYVHRLVAQEVLQRTLESREMVLHICDNPPCCNPAHLSLGNHRANTRDMLKKRRQSREESHWNAKLTAEQVTAIRRDPRSSAQAAPEYGVNARAIRKIRQGTHWRGRRIILQRKLVPITEEPRCP